MTMEKTDNELIAEFMGMTLENRVQWYRGNDFYCITSDLKYDTSWDWLMPVVERIESLIYMVSVTGFCDRGHQTTITTAFGRLIVEGSSDNKIESTHLAVVMFIKWYNSVTI